MSRQISYTPLSLPYTGAVRVTRNTSLRAGVAAIGKAGKSRARGYRCIQRAGEDGITDSAIQIALGMKGSTERPRRIELAAAQLIIPTDTPHTLPSGRRAVAWRVADESIDADTHDEYLRDESYRQREDGND